VIAPSYLFFEKGEKSPQLHPKDAHGFLLDYSQTLQEAIQKINLEATSLDLQWDEGGDNTPTDIIQKPNAFPNRPIAGEKHIQSSRLSAHANAHATEVATAVFLDSIFKRDHRINLARPAVDATMTPDGPAILHAYIIPHLSSIPCSTMPPSLSANNVVDEYHSTDIRQHPAAAPKTMPQEVERRRARRHRPIRETRT
jgi:hypothetical protein